MTKHEWFLPLAHDIAQAFSERYVPAFEEAFKAKGLEWWDASLTQAAVAAEPEPLTAASVLARSPFHAQATIEERLAGAASRGALAAEPDGGYRPTDLGREVYSSGLGLVRRTAADLAARLPEGAERLADVLGELVGACQAAPIEQPALTYSRSFDPGPGASAMERIRRYTLDLIAFRDDAHAAAWKAVGIEAFEWEAFSHVWGQNVWGDPVDRASLLAEKLGFRGYCEEDYAGALERLAERGWLVREDDCYRATAAGNAIRQAAEDATDRHYFGPWHLTENEAEELKGLMEQVRDALSG